MPSVTDPAAAEADRLERLHGLGLLDTPAEERFDRVARLAARMLDAPMALVSLVDADRQFFKACVGLDLRETPRSMSFCAHALYLPEALVVEDATVDPRFADNSLVTGPPNIRFYAGHPVRAADGQPLGTLCVLDTRPRRPDEKQLEMLRDLAELAELEINAGRLSTALAARRESDARLGEQQRALAQMQEQFLRAAAHELRTPLTNVRGYAESLLDPLADPVTDEQELAVGAIVRNTARLEDLVEDMLLVLRLEAGEMALEPVDLDLAGIAAGAAESVAARAAEAGVSIETSMAATPARADRRLAERMTQRLVAAAVAATPSGGRVAVITEPAGDGGACLRVRDGGPGLSDDEAARALAPFFRAAVPATAGATGFALTIARGVAAVHGGRLELRAGPGTGSEVRVTLPAADVAPLAP
jgi:signal transduction histidine kinase